MGDALVALLELEFPERAAEDGLVADDALLEEVVHRRPPQEEPDQLLADVRLGRLVHARLQGLINVH